LLEQRFSKKYSFHPPHLKHTFLNHDHRTAASAAAATEFSTIMFSSSFRDVIIIDDDDEVAGIQFSILLYTSLTTSISLPLHF
jgi:hypothetical protein